MDTFTLIGLSKLTMIRENVSIYSNNIANSATNGFKADLNREEAYEMPVAKQNFFPQNSRNIDFVVNAEVYRDHSQGSIEPTGNPKDVALFGPGFLVTEIDGKEYYFRDGALVVDNQGTLVNQKGNPVMGVGGPITLTQEDVDIHIDKQGNISSERGTIGKLRVVEFADNRALEKVGYNLYTSSSPAQEASSTQVLQGSLEGSNVSPIVELGKLNEALNNYLKLSKLIQSHRDSRKNNLNSLARFGN